MSSRSPSQSSARRSSRISALQQLSFAVFAVGASLGVGQSVQAAPNTVKTFNSGSTDLTNAANYTPTTAFNTTTDLLFNGSYTATAFTLNTGISIGTLNDTDLTQTLSVDNTSATADTFTFNGGTNNIATTGAANAADILFVKTGANLNIGSASTSNLGLIFAATGNIDDAGTLTIGTGAPITVNTTKVVTFTGVGTTVVNSAITDTGGLASTGTSVTIAGAIGGVGTLAVSAGSLTLTNANAFSGATTVSGTGTLQLQNVNAIQNSALTLSNGATLQLRANTASNGTTSTFASGAVTLPASISAVTFDVNNTGTGTGSIFALGGAFNTLNVNGGGGNNVGTTINVTSTGGGAGGTLQLGAIPLATSGNNGNLIFNPTTGNLNLTGTITASSGNATQIYDTGSGATAITGALNGNGRGISLNLSGTGVVTLTGNASTTGGNGLNLYNGTLNLTNASALTNLSTITFNSATPTFGSAGTITLNNTSGGALVETGNNAETWNTGFTFTGTNNLSLGTGAVTVVGKDTVTVSASTLTTGGATGSGIYGVTKAGAGTLTLGGFAVTATGAATIGDTAGAFNLGSLTRASGGTADFSGANIAGIAFTGTNAVAEGATTGNILVTAASNGVAYASALGGTTFAIVPAAGTVAGLATYSSTYTALNNVDVTNGDTPASGVTVNTLRFNAATDALTLAGTNTVNTGGILVTPTATAASTTGGTIRSGGGKELVILDYGAINVGSVIADSAGGASVLTLGGTGTTTLSAANTFTGQTNLSIGTLNLSNTLALQNSTLQYNAGGALVFDQSVTGKAFSLGGLSSSVNIALVNNATTPAPIALTVGGNNSSTTYSGVLSGTGGSLIKTGTGTFTISNANTYTGATAVNGGGLQFNSGGSILNSAVTVGSAGQVVFASNNNESAFVTGGIAGAGGIAFTYDNPSNVFTLNEANTYTGATSFTKRGVFQPGVATVYSGGVPVSGAFGVNSQFNFVNGSGGETVILNGKNQQVGSLTNGQGGNGIVLNGANLTIGGDNLVAPTTFSGQITGGLIPGGATGTHYNALGSGGSVAGNLIKIGTGTQILAGSNFYVGSTIINGGILSISSIANGGVATTLTAGAAAGATSLTVASTAGVASGQTIVGSGGLQNQTVSSFTSNTVTFATAIPDQAVNSGTAVYFGTGNGLGISTNVAANLVLDGGALQYTGAAASTDRLFTVGSTEAGGATGTLDASGTGALSFINTGSIAYGTVDQARTLGLTGSNTGANVFAPLIADNGAGAVSLTKSGVGSWTITNANTYSGGTTVSAGTLSSAVAGGYGTGNVTVNPTGTTLAGSATLNSTGSIASTAAVTVNTNSAAIGTVNFNGAAPTIGSLAGTGNVVLNNAAGTTLTIGGGSLGNASSSFSGAISQGAAAGNLAVGTTGTVTLSGNDTYTGSTTISSAGTLNAAGTGANKALGGTTSIAVNNGGTLLLSTASQVNNAAPITMGTTAPTTGILSVAAGANQGTAATVTNGAAAVGTSTAGMGALTLNNTSTLNYGGGATTLVFGVFTANNGSVLNVTGYSNTTATSDGLNSGAATDDRLVFNNGGGADAPLTSFNFGSGPGVGVFEVNLDNGFYEVAVPEPSTWAAGVLGLGALGFRLRRRVAGMFARRGASV